MQPHPVHTAMGSKARPWLAIMGNLLSGSMQRPRASRACLQRIRTLTRPLQVTTAWAAVHLAVSCRPAARESLQALAARVMRMLQLYQRRAASTPQQQAAMEVAVKAS